MSVEHYENFPVASILLPASLRPAVEAIYAFARYADDVADEGDASNPERLRQLQELREKLDLIGQQKPPGDVLFERLASVIHQYQLPLQPFYDLLSAFGQDTQTTRYSTYPELLDYCTRSANPVGLLMLHLYQQTSAQDQRDSDAICTALQLTNFWQDIGIDWDKQRIYLPTEDMQRFGVSEQHIAARQCDPAWRALMQFETGRTRALMLSGAALAKRLPGRFGWELRLVVQGGLRILEKIDACQGDVFRHRPVIHKSDWPRLIWRALWM